MWTARSTSSYTGMSSLLIDMHLTFAVSPAGGLVLSDGVRLWRLTADAQTFQPIDDDVTTLMVIGLGGSLIAARGDLDSVSFYTGTDGVHWVRSKLN